MSLIPGLKTHIREMRYLAGTSIALPIGLGVKVNFYSENGLSSAHFCRLSPRGAPINRLRGAPDVIFRKIEHHLWTFSSPEGGCIGILVMINLGGGGGKTKFARILTL